MVRWRDAHEPSERYEFLKMRASTLSLLEIVKTMTSQYIFLRKNEIYLENESENARENKEKSWANLSDLLKFPLRRLNKILF